MKYGLIVRWTNPDTGELDWDCLPGGEFETKEEALAEREIAQASFDSKKLPYHYGVTVVSQERLNKMIDDYESEHESMQEGLFGSIAGAAKSLVGGDSSKLGGREGKEKAAQALIGSEDVDVTKVDDEELNGLIQKLGNVSEGKEVQIPELIAVLKEMKASPRDMLEALQVHCNVHLSEAREIFRDYL